MGLIRKALLASPLIGLVLLLPACGEGQNVPEKPTYAGPIRGKVTYKGKPVPYGAVLLFSLKKEGERPKEMVPSGSGVINKDGTYELNNVPEGPAMLCVATDPDVPLMQFMQPTGMGGGVPGGGPPMPGGGPPMMGGGPPMPGGGPPMAGGQPPLPPPPPGGGAQPAVPGGPPPVPGGAGPKRPPIPKGKEDKGKVPPNPFAEGLSDEDKKLLLEIHDKYGKVGLSPLAYVVVPGSQTHDIKLK